MQDILVIDECVLMNKYHRTMGKMNYDNACSYLKNNLKGFRVICIGDKVSIKGRIHKEIDDTKYINTFKEYVNYCAITYTKKDRFKECVNGILENEWVQIRDTKTKRWVKLSLYDFKGIDELFPRGISDITIKKGAEMLSNNCQNYVYIVSHDRGRELESSSPCVDRIAIPQTDDIDKVLENIKKKLKVE